MCLAQESQCMTLCPSTAASVSVLFCVAQSTLCAPVCVFVSVLVLACALFPDVHQIKAFEHHNRLLYHHFSNMRLATERQRQSQKGELTFTKTLRK